MTIPRVCIVITDGQSQDDVLTPANAARDPGGITLFAIGVGTGIDVDELNQIANDPDDKYRFEVGDFTVFNNIASLIAQQTCIGNKNIFKTKWSLFILICYYCI